jgi:glutathione S-transferase
MHPVAKVPSLILENGETIFDGRMIIDYIDRQVPDHKILVSENADKRVEVLRVEAVALVFAEKIYERRIEFSRRHPDKVDEVWAARL